MNKKKIIKLNLIISGSILLGITFLSIPCSFLNIKFLLNIFVWIIRIDVFYFVISLVLFLINLDIKRKPKEKKPKTKKKQTKKVGYYYYPEKPEPSNQDSNVTSRSTYKNTDDRLYEEAVRYYGKSYAMGRSKQDLIDDYMNEK